MVSTRSGNRHEEQSPPATPAKRQGTAPKRRDRQPHPKEAQDVSRNERYDDEDYDHDALDEDERGGSQTGSMNSEDAARHESRRHAPWNKDDAASLSFGTPRRSHGSQKSGRADTVGDDAQQQVDAGGNNSSSDGDGQDQRMLMALSLPELSKTAKDLISELQTPQQPSGLHRRLLKLRSDTFATVLEIYQDMSRSPFIDYPWVEEIDEAPKAVGTANLATTLEMIDRVQNGDTENILGSLKALDEFFHKLFRPFGDGANNLGLAIDIRTLHLIEALARGPNIKRDTTNRMIASIFFESVDDQPWKDDYTAIFMRAASKPLSHRAVDDASDACSARVHSLVASLIKARKDRTGLDSLREVFPLDDILTRLRDWINRVLTPDDDFHDAQEVIETEEYIESQPIQRSTEPPRKSLFSGKRSLAVLAPGKHGPISTGQQKRQRLDSSSPRDNGRGGRGDSAEELGSDAFDSPFASPQTDDGNDESDEDQFQTAREQINPDRAASVSRRLQATLASRAPQPPTRLPTRPPEPVSRRPGTVASAPVPDRRIVDPERRAHILAGPKLMRHRVAWSQHDTAKLIELIGKCGASWSTIEEHYTDEFENPRNQQAYRDKARNLKTEFLMRDGILPKGFDDVSISSKERERILKVRKNPERREDEVEHGKPICTDL